MGDVTLEEKCENLMNVVVESRKKFGKRCSDYEKKTAIVENQLLNLQINTISNCKPKHQISPVDVTEMFKDVEDFTAEILERQHRIEGLKKKMVNFGQLLPFIDHWVLLDAGGYGPVALECDWRGLCSAVDFNRLK